MPTPFTEHEVLEAVRSEIQAEHALVSHRMAWYVASQSFLMTAYSIAWGNGHNWTQFFQFALPILGIGLSIIAWLGIWSAIRVQWDAINLQQQILEKLKTRQATGTDEWQLLHDYSQLTAGERNSGCRFHLLAMVPALLVPLGFLFAWAIAFAWSGMRATIPPTGWIPLILSLVVTSIALAFGGWQTFTVVRAFVEFDKLQHQNRKLSGRRQEQLLSASVGSSLATTETQNDAEQKNRYDVSRKQLEYEDGLFNQRITWVIAFQALLLVPYADLFISKLEAGRDGQTRFPAEAATEIDNYRLAIAYAGLYSGALAYVSCAAAHARICQLKRDCELPPGHPTLDSGSTIRFLGGVASQGLLWGFALFWSWEILSHDWRPHVLLVLPPLFVCLVSLISQFGSFLKWFGNAIAIRAPTS